MFVKRGAVLKSLLIFIMLTNLLIVVPPRLDSVYANTTVNTATVLPPFFDLRNVDGINYVTSIREQQGGTCWAFGTMASLESNLLVTGNWQSAGEIGEPDLAEYHLDWWNGFNTFNNDDDPAGDDGISVHSGGDYKIAAAYLSRGEGAVRNIDAQSYIAPPGRYEQNYHYYYVRDIEWYTAGADLQSIGTIKKAIMDGGAIATIINIDPIFLDVDNYTHYQPRTSKLDSWAHAIAIVGWDDMKITQASQPGAWLCKNSWGTDWGLSGYFWVSYYDKFCCQEPIKYKQNGLGTVSFKNVEPMRYDHVYYHDYHGWRGNAKFCNAIFNAFTANCNEIIQAVSFYTTADNAEYTVKIYDEFENGELENQLSVSSGFIEHRGFHTIELNQPVKLTENNDFYVYLEVSNGGYPLDRTSVFFKPLMGSDFIPLWWLMKSKSQLGESYFRFGSLWLDLHWFNPSANFCVKCLCNPWTS